jgi:hypothetical protein
MGAFLIYIYVENPQKFNIDYEEWKQYNSNKEFYKNDKENPSEEGLLEFKENKFKHKSPRDYLVVTPLLCRILPNIHLQLLFDLSTSILMASRTTTWSIPPTS